MKLPEVWPEDFKEELKLQLPVAPGMNAESVVIECLRKNEHLCAEVVTKDLFVTFGHLLNEFPDPSISPVLEFFEIVCCPCDKAILRNQSITVDVFMSDDLPNLKNCVASIFSPNASSHQCAAPERIAKLLSACIVEGNIQTASHLQRNRLTMDANLLVIEGFLTKIKASQDNSSSALSSSSNDELVDDAYLGEMLILLSLMMEILVVDPRIYRRPVVWDMITLINKPLLSKFNHTLLNQTRKTLEIKKRLNTAVACGKITSMIISGARSLGLFELEARYENEIRSDIDSILNSGLEIYKSNVIAQDKELSNVFESLVDSIDVTKLGEVSSRRGRASSMVDIRSASKSVSTSAPTLSLAAAVSLGKTAVGAHDAEHIEEEGLDLSAIDQYEDPITMLSHFGEALWNNPHVSITCFQYI